VNILRIAGLCTLLSLAAGCQNRIRSSGTTSRRAEPRAPPIRFVDVTRQAGVSFRHHHGGGGAHYYIETMGPGCAWLDYDNDGWLDLLLLQGAPLPDYRGAEFLHPVLYRNNRDGTFCDVTVQVGLDLSFYGLGVAVGDYDNDGWPDLFITALHGNRLFHNEAGKRFTDVTARAGVAGQDMSTGAAWLDYDNDGYLDLFVCRYMDYDLETNPRCKDALGRPGYCTPHVYTPTRSFLYHNNHDGAFTDVTSASGVGSALARAMGVACADFNDDGLIDIFVASDLTANLLFLNRGDGTFEEHAMMSGVAYSGLGVARAGMGVDCGDYDGDGDMDLIVTTFENESASLYENLGHGLFEERSIVSGIASASSPYLSWGCKFADFDLDGWPDLFWVSGHVDDHAQETANSQGRYQPAQLLRNQGNKTFADISKTCGEFFLRRQSARGAAFGDFDNDGDLDVAIMCNDGPAILLRNDTPPLNHWIQVRLVGRHCNRDGIGARVAVRTPGRQQVQFVRSGTSYLSDHDRRLLFGIGPADRASVTVRWPCGLTQQATARAGALLIVEESRERPRSQAP
jgi:enediyne biosynthesis protein E4